MGDKEREEEREKNKKVLVTLLEETQDLQNSSTSEGEIREVLKKCLVDHFKASSFNQCENQKLNLLKDTKMDVKIKRNATPKRTMKPIPCPWNLREKARSDLAAGVKLGIIEKVSQHGQQPLWISPAIFVEKSDGGCRRVVNYKALNKQCSREPNHTPDVLKLASQVPSVQDSSTGKLLFSVLDAWNGYHSIGLTE